MWNIFQVYLRFCTVLYIKRKCQFHQARGFPRPRHILFYGLKIHNHEPGIELIGAVLCASPPCCGSASADWSAGWLSGAPSSAALDLGWMQAAWRTSDTVMKWDKTLVNAGHRYWLGSHTAHWSGLEKWYSGAEGKTHCPNRHHGFRTSTRLWKKRQSVIYTIITSLTAYHN